MAKQHEDLIPERPVDDRPATEGVELIETAVGKAQYDEVVALLKATQADFENFQKRNAKERESDRQYYVANLARDLLAVYDNLQRAIDAAKTAGDQSPLMQGVSATLNQWLQVFARHGITPIDALGHPFDPNLHEAVMQQPSPEHEPGTVLQVLQQGFQIHDRVLRPASVIVSTQG
jgi:molecular chaperone GrpE